MKFSTITTWIYAALMLVGGVVGYIQAHSIPSLISGVVFSTLLFGSGFLMFKEKKIGYVFALTLVCLLTVFFSYRFASTEKFMPAGLMTIISAAVGIALLTKNPYRFK